MSVFPPRVPGKPLTEVKSGDHSCNDSTPLLKPRLLLILTVSALWLGAAGCATPPTQRATPTPNSRTTADTDYPAWTKAAGWLLLPFTGASQSIGF